MKINLYFLYKTDVITCICSYSKFLFAVIVLVRISAWKKINDFFQCLFLNNTTQLIQEIGCNLEK